MSGRGSHYSSSAPGRGQRLERTDLEDSSSSLGIPILELSATETLPSSYPAKLSGFRCVASYNWLDSSKPTILVPGSPAIWSPPAYPRRLSPDKGEVFIDQNGARYGSFPLEPMFRAIQNTKKMNPDLVLDKVNAVICRNTMAKLFDFVTNNSRAFEIDVEMINDKLLFIRKEKKTREIIEGFRGFGFTFPEEYTSWDNEVKGSSSHHRIAEYDFAGIKYLLRFETDGYLRDKAKSSNTAHKSRIESSAGPTNVADLLKGSESLTVKEKQPVAENLTIYERGTKIDQEAIIEIKTRANHRPLDLESVLPRLWMSQTPNLIAAYHKGGRFEDVRVLNVRKEIETWERNHSADLQRLDALIRRIIETVQSTKSKKFAIKRNEGGKLRVWEMDVGHRSALPDDLHSMLQTGQKQGSAQNAREG